MAERPPPDVTTAKRFAPATSASAGIFSRVAFVSPGRMAVLRAVAPFRFTKTMAPLTCSPIGWAASPAQFRRLPITHRTRDGVK